MFRILEVRTGATPEASGRWKQWSERERREGLPLYRNRRQSRYESVMKVLKPDSVFRFCDNESCNGVPRGFYSIAGGGEHVVDVNICAVVGENGMGKSSLIELMIRLLNNAAFALRPARKSVGDYPPRFVRDIYASMKFEAGDNVFEIRQDDTVVEVHNVTSGALVWRYDFESRNDAASGVRYPEEVHDTASQCRKWLAGLFYTVVVNYSAYSYNVNDFKPEWVEPDEYDEGEDKDRTDVERLCWLDGIFHKNDGYQLPLVLNPFRKEGNIDYNNEQELMKTRLFLLAMAEDSPLKKMFQGKEPYSFVFDANLGFSMRGNRLFASAKVLEILAAYGLRKLDETGYRLLQQIGEAVVLGWSRCTGIDLMKCVDVSNSDDVRTLNYLVYKTLKICLTYWKYYSRRHAFEQIIHGSTGVIEDEVLADFVSDYICDLFTDPSHITLKARRALAYLIFKHYGDCKVLRHRAVNPHEITLSDFDDIIKSRLEQQDEIITQLRREFPVKPRLVNPVPPVEHKWELDELLPAGSFYVDMMLKRTDNGDYIRFNSLSSGERQMVNSISTMLYHVHNLRTTWDNLTDDANDHTDGVVRYRYINLIFDEIELYFHPKYQVQLVRMLLDGLGAMNLGGKIRGINILLSTHSPFVLSDIPLANILLMRDGRQVEAASVRETFCANVYDILGNGFFMTQFAGDFAVGKVDDIVKRLNDPASNPVDPELLSREIELIGDDYVRESLRRRFNELFADRADLERERERLLRRIDDIDQRLGRP